MYFKYYLFFFVKLKMALKACLDSLVINGKA